MKRRAYFLLGFLLVLFIGSMSISNVSGMAYEYSSDSIYSFSETLEDDVLFYPDGYYDDTPVLATFGGGQASNNDWVDTWVIDNSSWSVFSGEDMVEYAYFVAPIDGIGVEGFEYSIYARGIGDPSTGNISYFNKVNSTTTNLTILVKPPVAENYTWFNGSIHSGIYKTEQFDPDGDDCVLIWIDWGEGGGAVQIDYMEIRFHYLSLRDDNYFGGDHSGDSFWNVSDWFEKTYAGVVDADCDITTDGDVATFSVDLDDINSEYCVFQNNNFSGAPISDDNYLEMRFQMNGRTRLYIRVEDFDGTVNIVTGWRGEGVDIWQTWKWYLGGRGITGGIYAISIIVDDYANAYDSDAAELYIDYLRVGPSDEMGLENDFSITEGISSSDGGTIASDGDKVTLTADGDGSTFLIVADTTTTASAISTAYYPFFGIAINSGSGNWTLEQYDGSAYATLQSSTAISAVTERFNMNSLDTYVEWWRISLTASSVLVSDWAKAYSIANFSSYSDHADIGVDDYFYVDDDVLYCEIDESDGDHMRMNYDPLLDISYTIYDVVNSTVFKDGLQSDLVGYNWIDSGGFLQDNWTAELTQDLTGTPYLEIDTSGSWEIQDLIFYGQVPEWLEITNVEIVFFVAGWHIINSIVLVFTTAIVTYSLNLIFLFLGLAMIPTSTLFLVKGGRSEMSTDKLFYVLIIFIMGWALFLGGIM